MGSFCPSLVELCLDCVASLLVTASADLRSAHLRAVAGLPIELIERLIERLASDDLLSDALFPLVTASPIERGLLSGASSLSRTSLQQLERCSTLRQLDLAQCAVDDTLLCAVATSCTRLSRVDVSENALLTRRAILTLAQRCPELEYLNLLKCHSIDSLAIRSLADCKKLLKLNLGWCRVDDASFLKIAEGCPLLEALELWLVRDLTGAGLAQAAPFLGKLKKLSLWAMSGLTDDAVQALALSCRILESVNFQANHQLSDAAFLPARPRGGRASNAPSNFFGGSLQKIVLSDCKRITALAVRVIVASSPLLQKINLASVSISDVEVAQLARCCPHLRRLDLEGTDVSAAGLLALAERNAMQNIRTVNLYGCTNIDDEALELLADNCTDSLRKIHLVDCQVTDRSLKKLFLQRPALQVLSLGRSEDDDAAHSVTDESLGLVQKLVYLRKLEFYHVDSLSDRALIPILSSCRLLKSFSISFSETAPLGAVTDASVTLLSRLNLLVELSLIGLRSISDGPVCLLSQRCTRLASLEFGDLPSISAKSWSALAKFALRLRSLTLWGVDISAEFANAIAAGCPRLTQIDLEQAFSVDASALINPRPQTITIIPPHSI